MLCFIKKISIASLLLLLNKHCIVFIMSPICQLVLLISFLVIKHQSADRVYMYT